MALDSALSGGDVTNLAGVTTEEHVLLHVNAAALATARVNQTSFTYPLRQLTVDGTSADWSLVAAGDTVYIGSSAGAYDRGIYRVRKAGTGTTLELAEISEGDAGLLPTDLRPTSIQNDDHITVYRRFDIWAALPKVEYGDTSSPAYEDADRTVGTFNTTPEPVVNITINGVPSHGFAYNDDGQTYATMVFVATADHWSTSASATFAWTAPAAWGSPTAGAVNTNTVTYQVPVSATNYIIKLVTTPNAGSAFTSNRVVWVKNRTTTKPLEIADIPSDTSDRTGTRMSLVLNDNVVSNLQRGAMVMVAKISKANGSTISSMNSVFPGWITKIAQSKDPDTRSATIEIVGPTGRLAQLPGTAHRLTKAASPANWQELVSALCYVDFAVWWILRNRAVGVLQLFNYTKMGISTGQGRLTDWRIAQGSLLAQCQSTAKRYRKSNFGADYSGEIFVRPHPNNLTYSTRSSNVVTRGTLSNSIGASIGIPEELTPSVGRLRVKGHWSDGTGNYETWSDAPGKQRRQAPNDEEMGDVIADSAADLYAFAGLEEASRNSLYGMVRLTISKNYDVIKPAQMQFWGLSLVAADRADEAVWVKNAIPYSVSRRHLPDGCVDLTVLLEIETAGRPGVDAPRRAPINYQFGAYDSMPFLPTPSIGWGNETTVDPISGGPGVLGYTSDGFVWRTPDGETYSDISPASVQRSSIGTTIKMIADPWDYKRLILFGSQGALICDDHTASNVVWRDISLESTASASSAPSPITATYAFGTGATTLYDGETYTLESLGAAPGAGSTIEVQLSDCVYFTLTNVSGWTDNDAGETNSNFVDCDGNNHLTVAPSIPPWNVYQNSDAEGYDVIGINSGSASFSVNITVTFVNGGGGGGSVSPETFISDIQGSINRKGYFCWLSVREVAGTDRVFFNYTTNNFATRKSVNVARYSADMLYTIQLRSYNTISEGVIRISAGDPAAGSPDAFVYESDDWGVTWAAAATALTEGGGSLGIPYQDPSANADSSPRIIVITGLDGANLKAVSGDGSVVTAVTGGSKALGGAYAFGGYTLDGRKLQFVTTDGVVYKSDDEGDTWAAGGTNVPLGASGDARALTGWPTNDEFLLAAGHKTLAYSTDRSAAWTDIYSDYDAFRSATYGSEGETILAAFGDLSSQYTQPVTQ